VYTHQNRFSALALALTTTFLLVACGGGGGPKAASTDSASSSSETSASSAKTATVRGRLAATGLNAARKKADTASVAPFKELQAAFKSQDLVALKAAQARLRDVDFAFDKEVRSVLFPDDVANERNAYLKDNADVIAAEDAGQNAASVADFDTTNLRAGRLSTKRRDDGFALLRALGVPDLQDNGHPAAPAPQGQVVLKEDFSNPNSGWFAGSKPEGTYGYAAAKYEMTSAAIGTGMASDSNLTGSSADPALTSLDGVSIEVDVTETKAVGGTVGLHCHANEAGSYAALIEPTTGFWTIGATKNGVFTALISDSSTTIKDVNGLNRLRMDCSRSGTSVTIALFVNGEKMGDATDKTSALSAGAIALTAETFNGGCCTSALFDNLIVRSIG